MSFTVCRLATCRNRFLLAGFPLSNVPVYRIAALSLASVLLCHLLPRGFDACQPAVSRLATFPLVIGRLMFACTPLAVLLLATLPFAAYALAACRCRLPLDALLHLDMQTVRLVPIVPVD